MNDRLIWKRLARTNYLVIPKLALMAMPEEWQSRMEALLQEAEEAGLQTPEYYVFRDMAWVDRGRSTDVGVQGVKDIGTYEHPFYTFTGKPYDPWADYRHGKIEDVCPGFVSKEKVKASSED